MSHELDGLLRASIEAETPDWLDQLVTERVLDLVNGETASPAASSQRARKRDRPDSTQPAVSIFQQGSELVQRLVIGLLRRNRRTRRSNRRLLHGWR